MAETAQQLDADSLHEDDLTEEEAAPVAPSSRKKNLTERDFKDFLSQYSSSHSDSAPVNLLNERYRIELNQPMPALNSSMANAYAVTDLKGDGKLYALALPPSIPCRQKTIDALTRLNHPNLIKIVDDGAVRLSDSGDLRKVVILEQPEGIPLSRLLEEHRTALPDQFIIRYILTPLNEILLALQHHGINHGRINLDSIYIHGNDITLGECISEPSGYSQHFLFEPLERAMALPCGKGSGDMAGDCYALGVLACILSFGGGKFLTMSGESYREQVLEKGSYAVLTNKQDVSDNLQDLLRGTLNDNKKERWNPEHIARWLDGKRYNLIPPASPKEATRPVVFLDQDYFGSKALANSMHLHSESAYTILQDNKLARWAELSLHKKDMTEQLDKLIKAAEGERGNSSRIQFLLARAIISLDPSGPLRSGVVSVNPDGLGSMLADAYRNKDQRAISDIMQIIENDLLIYWSDLQTTPLSQELTTLLWKVPKIRQQQRFQSLGFGIERCLYDLNPSLPCQSELLLPYHVNSIRELLFTLDMLAREKYTSHAPVDRHIAAFLASKLDIAKEVRVVELSFDRELAGNSKFIGLKILALAQEKAGSPPLPGLAHWATLHIYPLLEKVYNRESRQTIKEELRKSARRGKLLGIANIMFNAQVYLSDQSEFSKAVRLYQYNKKKIEYFQSTNIISLRAKTSGHRGALILGYTALFATFYNVLQEYMNF